MKTTKAIWVAVWNFLIGFISLWWFVLSYTAAVNIDNKEDAVFLKPFGWLALIVLLLLIFCSNLFIFKKYIKSYKFILLFQISSFILGLAISLILAAFKPI